MEKNSTIQSTKQKLTESIKTLTKRINSLESINENIIEILIGRNGDHYLIPEDINDNEYCEFIHFSSKTQKIEYMEIETNEPKRISCLQLSYDPSFSQIMNCTPYGGVDKFSIINLEKKNLIHLIVKIWMVLLLWMTDLICI